MSDELAARALALTERKLAIDEADRGDRLGQIARACSAMAKVYQAEDLASDVGAAWEEIARDCFRAIYE